MSEVTTVDARRDFSDVLNRVAYGHERMVLTRRGKRLVAVVLGAHASGDTCVSNALTIPASSSLTRPRPAGHGRGAVLP